MLVPSAEVTRPWVWQKQNKVPLMQRHRVKAARYNRHGFVLLIIFGSARWSLCAPCYYQANWLPGNTHAKTTQSLISPEDVTTQFQGSKGLRPRTWVQNYLPPYTGHKATCHQCRSPVWRPIRSLSFSSGMCPIWKWMVALRKCKDIMAISSTCWAPLRIGSPLATIYASPMVSTLRQHNKMDMYSLWGRLGWGR